MARWMGRAVKVLSCVAVCASASAAAMARTPQVLRMRDAVTQQEIAIVGTVHYNPASISASRDEVIAAMARHDQKLGAVVVESCFSRWNRSLELAPPGSFMARSIVSEMQSAAGVAVQSNVVRRTHPAHTRGTTRARPLTGHALVCSL